ncbi:hypothetical protein BBM40_01590 [Vibrio parahaemolyticus]|uniref:hypothetical protein n=1 Tax=Vibrio harveyi group TaxID=717610 RepID=UPI00046F0246|nr:MULTISPECIES: hypothetical protein [Vibrio harveyi group]HBK5919897.1 hypothetical protein [Vibrio alginolyticus]HDY7525607.1 hypothetical protein [Vibrio vulnificus]EGQ7871776.1 hypothetical protein [Vibrio parahaemolyticus]EGQ9918140.1 hypothetical protein [Vibrio parahaemolyticus]EGR0437309.1 hypothetical protein [Vibrio parahaemolyticus]
MKYINLMPFDDEAWLDVEGYELPDFASDDTTATSRSATGRPAKRVSIQLPQMNTDKPPAWLDDVVSGVLNCYLERKSTKGSSGKKAYVDKYKLMALLQQHSRVYTSKSIQELLGVKERQAQKYMEVLSTLSIFVNSKNEVVNLSQAA